MQHINNTVHRLTPATPADKRFAVYGKAMTKLHALDVKSLIQISGDVAFVALLTEAEKNALIARLSEQLQTSETTLSEMAH